MKADLTSLTLKSSGFAKIIVMHPDDRFPKNARKLYLLHSGRRCQHNTTVLTSCINEVLATFDQCYSICEIQDAVLPHTDDNTFHTQIENGYIILLPIISLDRIESLYLWGRIPETTDLKASLSSLVEDMNSLNAVCTQAAWINLSLNQPVQARRILKDVLTESDRSKLEEESDLRFRIAPHCNETELGDSLFEDLTSKPTVLYSQISELQEAHKTSKYFSEDLRYSKQQKSYYERRKELIDKLPANRKAMNNKAQKDKALQEVLELWSQLTSQEQTQIMLAMLKGTNVQITQNVCDEILNREKIGQKSRFSFTFSPWKKEFKTYKFKDISKYCPFLQDESGKLYPIHFGNSTSQVLYALALINKCQESNNSNPVNLRSNKQAFCKLYRLMFHSIDKEAEENYDELFIRNVSTENSTLRAGRIQEYYDKIRNELTKQLEYLNENPSPYLIDDGTPVAIPTSRIHLPEEFKKIQVC